VTADSPYRDPAVADVYRRVAVPTHFVRPARDLASLMAVADGDRVLDVGTGTGTFARAASEAAGSSGFIVGVDRAMAMLRALDARGADLRIVGETPGLPFADDVFDAVGASFVLPHCRDHSSSLADMARVCRPGGRIGISAWGSLANEAGRLWKQIVDTYVDADQLQEAFRTMVPWEEWFYNARHLERALADARLTAVEGTTREYTIEISAGDYVAMKQAGVEGMLIRQLTSDARWNSFTREIESAFQARFRDSITFVRNVHFGVATKPQTSRF
jgi:ubiquinone/menaquinone biosynthesis C-methylase UbiE